MRTITVRVGPRERRGKPPEARPPGANELIRMGHWRIGKARSEWKGHAHAAAVRTMARGPYVKEWMLTAVGQSGRVPESTSYIPDRAAWWPLERVRVGITWRCKIRRRRDFDNLVSGLKPLLDALVSSGIIRDDDTSCIVELGPLRIEVGAEEDETILEIEEVPSA